jgi:hypothetical protein
MRKYTMREYSVEKYSENECFFSFVVFAIIGSLLSQQLMRGPGTQAHRY